MPVLTVDDLLKFSMPVTESGCWIWIGGLRNRDGYGQISVGRRNKLAHRVAYEIANGAIPAETCVCHRCDVPSCVNPAHLFLGTIGANNRDRDAKGRTAIGNRNGKSKLKTAWIPDIKRSRAPDAFLAEICGVTPAAIWHVRKGINWKHVA